MSVEEIIKKAEQHEDEGHLADALTCWREVLREESKPSYLVAFARVARELRLWTEAEQALRAAISADPDSPLAYEGLGWLYFKTKDFCKAEEYLSRSLKLKARPTAGLRLGVVKSTLGLRQAARACFLDAVKLDPCYEEAYYHLALTYVDDDPTRAIEAFETSIQIDPAYALAHRDLGWTLRMLGRIEQARHHLEKAIELDSSDGWAYVYLGNVYFARDEFEEAETMLHRALQVWPNSSIPYWTLATLYESSGRRDEAEELYKKALSFDSEDVEVNVDFGVFLKSLGEHQNAKIYLSRALRLDPNNQRAKSVLKELAG